VTKSAPVPNPVSGFQLTFFTQQNHRHHGKSLGQWLVETAHTLFERWLIGSVARQVIVYASCGVTVVRAADQSHKRRS